MAFRNTPETYGSVSKFFHWLMFLLILGMVILGFFLDDIPKDYQKNFYNLHKLIGVIILMLAILRAGWAFMNPKPRLPHTTPRFEKIAERLVHYSLYGILFIMPLAGWVMSSAANRPPQLFGYSFLLPVPQSKALDDFAGQIHLWVAWILIGVVALHVVAALKHHFIDKDNILKRMMPGSKMQKNDISNVNLSMSGE